MRCDRKDIQVTAPTPEKIQRRNLYDRGWPLRLAIEKSEDGEFVTYSDHLRHLKLAQIEVLEEVMEKHHQWMPHEDGACYMVQERDMRVRIAALRKEIEG